MSEGKKCSPQSGQTRRGGASVLASRFARWTGSSGYGIEGAGAGDPAEGSFFSGGAAVTAVYDPFEDAHVFAEAGPHEFSTLVFAEPVDMENARRTDDRFSHVHPMREVITHVVTAERQHGHGIAADNTLRTARRGGGFGAHRGAYVDAMDPIEGLIDERHRGRAARAED